MSKPPFSKKRKGKTVDPYPLGTKEKGKSKQTKKNRGRPRKPKAEKKSKRPIGIVYVNKRGEIVKVVRYSTLRKATIARGKLAKTSPKKYDRSGVYNLETGKVLVPVYGKPSPKGQPDAGVRSKIPMAVVQVYVEGGGGKRRAMTSTPTGPAAKVDLKKMLGRDPGVVKIGSLPSRGRKEIKALKKGNKRLKFQHVEKIVPGDQWDFEGPYQFKVTFHTKGRETVFFLTPDGKYTGVSMSYKKKGRKTVTDGRGMKDAPVVVVKERLYDGKTLGQKGAEEYAILMSRDKKSLLEEYQRQYRVTSADETVSKSSLASGILEAGYGKEVFDAMDEYQILRKKEKRKERREKKKRTSKKDGGRTPQVVASYKTKGEADRTAAYLNTKGIRAKIDFDSGNRVIIVPWAKSGEARLYLEKRARRAKRRKDKKAAEGKKESKGLKEAGIAVKVGREGKRGRLKAPARIKYALFASISKSTLRKKSAKELEEAVAFLYTHDNEAEKRWRKHLRVSQYSKSHLVEMIKSVDPHTAAEKMGQRSSRKSLIELSRKNLEKLASDMKYGGVEIRAASNRKLARMIRGDLRVRKKKKSKRKKETFQEAHERFSRRRKIDGSTFKLYGATDDPDGAKKRALKRWKKVHVEEMPEAIRRTDPDAAKYAVYVSGRRKGKKKPKKTITRSRLKKERVADLRERAGSLDLYGAPGEPIEMEDIDSATKPVLIDWILSKEKGEKYV